MVRGHNVATGRVEVKVNWDEWGDRWRCMTRFGCVAGRCGMWTECL